MLNCHFLLHAFVKKLILSCFLHDIGHLLLNESQSDSNFLQENLRHETIAYNFLKQYYPRKRGIYLRDRES